MFVNKITIVIEPVKMTTPKFSTLFLAILFQFCKAQYHYPQSSNFSSYQPPFNPYGNNGPQYSQNYPNYGAPQPAPSQQILSQNSLGGQNNNYHGPQNQNGPLTVDSAQNMLNTAQNEVNNILAALTDKYQSLFDLSSPLKIPFEALPDLSGIAEKCPKNGFFYSFSPKHMEAVHDVKNILMNTSSAIDLLDIAKTLKQDQRINPYLWFYSFASLAVNDPDLQKVPPTSPIDVIPDNFISAEILQIARTGEIPNSRYRSKRQAQCVVLDESVGVNNGIENQLWYFRESIPANVHHWYFHMMYPYISQRRENRRGELFYYMHSNILSRYNSERLSNGLGRTVPLVVQKGSILPPYYTHLASGTAGGQWSNRLPNTPVADIIHSNNPSMRANVLVNTHILTAAARINAGIDAGILYNSRGNAIPINNTIGVDILGDVIQSNSYSINPEYYGVSSTSGLHNNGHVIMSLASDPNYQSKTPPGVLADAAPALRDVAFYQWHGYISHIFDRHKSKLVPYAPVGGQLPLIWPGVSISSLNTVPQVGSGPANLLNTMWTTETITLNRGMDLSQFPNKANLQICAKQLDHQLFNYHLTINLPPNAGGTIGTVRIFLAPRFDENGNRFSMTAQRSYFFILDRFTVSLRGGANNIVRRSQDSSVTIPWTMTSRQMLNDPQDSTPYCGCGWPQNLLIPKGTPNGMTFDLFAMVTNGNEDFVRQTTNTPSCISAPTLCGIANQNYPDSKPMGYPFDRYPYTLPDGRAPANLDEYVSGIPNMRATQVVIKFNS